jgi:hypothetical protein
MRPFSRLPKTPEVAKAVCHSPWDAFSHMPSRSVDAQHMGSNSRQTPLSSGKDASQHTGLLLGKVLHRRPAAIVVLPTSAVMSHDLSS